MASYFFDTSALVKYYHIEVGTPEVLQLLQEPNARHFISRLTVIEAPSAFAIKVRTGELAASNFHRLRQRFLADVAQGRFRDMRLLQRHYREAGQLITTYFTRRFRTLAALQLAMALDLHRRGVIEQFVCADEPLCTVASEAGLAVLNPTQP